MQHTGLPYPKTSVFSISVVVVMLQLCKLLHSNVSRSQDNTFRGCVPYGAQLCRSSGAHPVSCWIPTEDPFPEARAHHLLFPISILGMSGATPSLPRMPSCRGQGHLYLYIHRCALCEYLPLCIAHEQTWVRLMWRRSDFHLLTNRCHRLSQPVDSA